MSKLRESKIILILGLLLTVYSVYCFLNPKIVCQWFLSPYLFPMILGFLTVVTSFFIEDNSNKHPIDLKKVCIVIVLTAAYYFLISHIHFTFATMIYLGALTYYFGEHSLKKIIPISVIIPLVLYLVFSVGLRVRLP